MIEEANQINSSILHLFEMTFQAKMWFVMALFVCLNYNCSEGSHLDLAGEEELELERQLKLLNKPPITTFQVFFFFFFQMKYNKQILMIMILHNCLYMYLI